MVCQGYLPRPIRRFRLNFLLLCVNEIFTSRSHFIWSTLPFRGLQSLQRPSIHRESSWTPRSVPSHGLYPSPAPSGDKTVRDGAGFARLSISVGLVSQARPNQPKHRSLSVSRKVLKAIRA